MQPEGNGRHCDSCCKTVVDFTGMSDAGILDYFKQHSGICGRFTSGQLNRDLSIQSVKSYHSWFYGAAACGVLLLYAAQAQARPGVQTLQDTTIQQNIQVSTANNLISRSFLFVFNSEDSVFKQPFAVHFEFGAFHLDTIPDASLQLGFHVPDSIYWDSIRVRIKALNGQIHELQIPGLALTGPFTGRNEIRLFHAADGLKFERIMPFAGIELPIVMGIPPMIWDFKIKPIEAHIQTQTLGFAVMGDTIIPDTHKAGMPEKVKNRPEQLKRLADTKVAEDQFWFVGFVGLFIAAVLFWVKRGPKPPGTGKH